MSENNKREFVEEDDGAALTVTVSSKKQKLDDDDDFSTESHNVVVDSSSSGCSVTSVGDEPSSSISSGNEIVKNDRKFVTDLEDPQISEAETETSTFITRNLRDEERKEENEALGETTEIESSLAATEGDNQKQKPAVSKTPTATEIEEFFSEVEDEEKKKRFMEKYNFDIVNDEPLQGRFKWDPID